MDRLGDRNHADTCARLVGLRRLGASGTFSCSGVRGCRVKAEVAERENELFAERRRGLLNHARTWALRGMKRARDEVNASACILVQTIEPQSRGLDHGHIVLGHATKTEKAFARLFVDALARSRLSMASASLTATATRSGGSANTRGRVKPSGQPGTCRST